MITALRQKVTVRRGGWISLRSKNLKAGVMAEGFVLVEPQGELHTKSTGQPVTAKDLLGSGLVGLWSKKSIEDSLEFAR